MIRQEIEEKFNSAIDLGVLALGSAIVSGILLITPAKAVGYIGVGSSVGGFIASMVTKKKLVKSAVEAVENKQTTIEFINEKLNQANLEYKALEAKKAKVLEIANQALALQEELTQLRDDVSAKDESIASLQSQMKQAIANSNANLEGIKETVLDALGERQRGLDQALEGLTKRKDYQLSDENVRSFRADIDEVITRYFKAVQETYSVEDCCNILHWATDELANVKVRMIRAHLTQYVADLYRENEELEKANLAWGQAKLVPLSLLEKVKADCIARLKEFHLDAKNQLGEIWGYAEQLEKQLPEDEKFFQDLRSQLQEYERKLQEASKPYRFVGASEQARVGNALIDYYLRSGLILDAIDWHGTELGYKLMFHFGRNGVYISPDTLHENDARQQIKAMTSSLSLPEFKQSERGGYIYLEVQQRMPSKKQSSAEDIKRLLTPLEKGIAKVIDNLSHKPTVRIMGATGEGKGVMARYLINQALASNSWYTRLHDPQDGSSEDHWGMPKVSRRGSELEEALVAVHDQMVERERSGWDVVTFDIFDEIDTHLGKQVKKDNFIDLCSRIRHQGMKLGLIGQNPKVGRAGFEWSDMQQMNCIYMGASAFDAIIANPQLQPKKDKLIKEYTALSEYYEIANEGLDDGEKHLFGLVVILGKTPFWVELPRPDYIEIACNSILLGESFKVSNSFKDFIEGKNVEQSSGKSAKTNRKSTPYASAETLINQRLADFPPTSDYVGVPAKVAKTDTSAKATCKKHPEAELRIYKDGRGYCPDCGNKIPKSQIEYR